MGEVSTPAAPSKMSRPLEEQNEDDSPVIISSSGNITFAYTDTSTTTTRTGIPPTNSGSQNGPSASSTQIIQQSTQHESPPQPFLPPPLPQTHEWPPPGPYHANDMHTFGTTPWSFSTPSFQTGPSAYNPDGTAPILLLPIIDILIPNQPTTLLVPP